MSSKLSQQQSDALRIMVFLATILVVLRHGVNLHHYYSGGHQWIPATDINIFIQRFISHFTNAAVPLFFAISGFLFFLNLSDFMAIKEKLLRRVHSLLLPFLLWNCIFLALWTCLYFTPQFHEQMIQSYGYTLQFSWFLSRLSWQPMVGQFWYIRTLMIFCCTTPLLLLIFRHKIGALLLLILLGGNWTCIDTDIFSSEGLLFFYAGGMIGAYRLHDEVEYSPCGWWTVPLAILGILAQIFFWETPFDACKMTILATMILLVQFSLFITRKKTGALLIKLSRYSFFIFTLHSVVVAGGSLLVSRVIPHTAAYSLASYVLCVIVAIVVPILLAKGLKRLVPRLYSTLAGGRG